MKKLIEKYAEMENVIPEAIQLIFKGNPVTKDDTPNKLEITSEDILEVCKVPGIFIPAKKPSTPSPADMDESSKFGYVRFLTGNQLYISIRGGHITNVTIA